MTCCTSGACSAPPQWSPVTDRFLQALEGVSRRLKRVRHDADGLSKAV
jgi:hypothetical protein